MWHSLLSAMPTIKPSSPTNSNGSSSPPHAPQPPSPALNSYVARAALIAKETTDIKNELSSTRPFDFPSPSTEAKTTPLPTDNDISVETVDSDDETVESKNLLDDSPPPKRNASSSNPPSTSKNSPKRTFTDINNTGRGFSPPGRGGRGRGRGRGRGGGRELPSGRDSSTRTPTSSPNKIANSPNKNPSAHLLSAKNNNNNNNNNVNSNTPHESNNNNTIGITNNPPAIIHKTGTPNATSALHNTPPKDSGTRTNNNHSLPPPSSTTPPPGTDVDSMVVDVVETEQGAFVTLSPGGELDPGANKVSHLECNTDSSSVRHPTSAPQDPLKAKTQVQAKIQGQVNVNPPPKNTTLASTANAPTASPAESTILLKLLEQVSNSVSALHSSVQTMESRISQVENHKTSPHIRVEPSPMASIGSTVTPTRRPTYPTATASSNRKTRQTTIHDTHGFACSGNMPTAPPTHVNTDKGSTEPPLSSPSGDSVDSSSSWTTVGPKGKPVDSTVQANHSDETSAAQSLASMKSWVRPSTSTSTTASSDTNRNEQPTIMISYRTSKGNWNKINNGTKVKFNGAYVNECALQLCNYFQIKYEKEVVVIRVTPKEITGSGDNMRFSGTIEFSSAALIRYGTDGFQVTRAHISKELRRLESLLQRTLTTKDYVFYEGMPYGVKALQFDFPPVRRHLWYVGAILVGAPAMLVPSTDSRANDHLADDIWNQALCKTEQGRTVMSKYETPYHRRQVMGVTGYSTTIGKTTHKIVGIAFPKSDEGNKIATAMIRSSWDESEDKPHFFEIAGGMSVTLLPIPSESKQRPAFFHQCVKQAEQVLKKTYTVRLPSVSKNIFNSAYRNTVVENWKELKFIHASARYGDSFPGCVLIFAKSDDIVQSSEEEIAEMLYDKSEGLLAPKKTDKTTTERYVRETLLNANSIRKKPSAPASSDSATVSFANEHKPPKNSPRSVMDLFITNAQREKQAKSVWGFARGRQGGSKRPWTAVSNGPGGVRSIGVWKWEEVEHRVKGCPYALYQNFPTKTEAFYHLFRTMPEAGVKDDASARALWETVPITATNLDNPFVFIPEHKRNGAGGQMWFNDDDTALLFARQLNTIGHPNYEPDDAVRTRRIAELNGETHADPGNSPTVQPTSPPDEPTEDPTEEPTEEMADESDDELPQSQVDAYSPAEATPVKRSRPNNHASTATGTYNHNVHTNYIIFSVAPFTLADEFKGLLCEHIVKDKTLLGKVSLVKKKGELDRFYIAAEVYDVKLGQCIIDTLSSKDFCQIPLNPQWIAAESWAHFYTIYKKSSSHGNLDKLATSSLITRLKQECPISHHIQLDELLCTIDCTFTIHETYQSWFGKTSFSPFGDIEPSTF